MTIEEELVSVREQKKALREQLAQRDELIMSEGTVWSLIKRCAEELAPVEQQIKEALIESEVIHQDETGLHVEGFRHWMHVTCTPTLTHYHVDKSRGQRALSAIGILAHFSGISIARIRGYLSTLCKQGMPLLSSLQATLCGHPVLPSL